MSQCTKHTRQHHTIRTSLHTCAAPSARACACMQALQKLERIIVEDFDCPWNRPRYMTTAMWGAAWANPGVSLMQLAARLEQAGDSFWKGSR